MLAPRGALVLALRLVLLVVAASGLVIGLVLGRMGDHETGMHVGYRCPMHAEVTSRAPGACPICGMDLEPNSVNGSAPPTENKASNYQTYDTARRRAYGPDMPAPAWVEGDGTVTAILYTDELAFRLPEERAEFSPSSEPTSAIPLRASTDAPEPWDRSTRRVHFHADGTPSSLRPHDVGWLRRVARSSEPAVLPSSAILEDAAGPYVLVLSNDGQMVTKRPIAIGRVFGGVASVLSGLGGSEHVLTTGAFFLDAERRLRRDTTIEIAPR